MTPIDLKSIASNTKEKKIPKSFEDIFNNAIRNLDEGDYSMLIRFMERSIVNYSDTANRFCLALIELSRLLQDARYLK